MKINYSFVPTPLGVLLVAGNAGRVVRIAFPEEDPGLVLEELASFFPEPEEGPMEFADELEQYFDGERREFGVRADLSLVRSAFSRNVLLATGRIPFGEVSTYGDVAASAGNRRAARATGNTLRANPVPILVPCHRVLPSTGGMGGYAGHEDRKALLLELEGVSLFADAG